MICPVWLDFNIYAQFFGILVKFIPLLFFLHLSSNYSHVINVSYRTALLFLFIYSHGHQKRNIGEFL